MTVINIECGDCPFLCNDAHASGCGAPFPIDHCEEFQKAMRNYEKYATSSPMRDGEEIRDFLDNIQNGKEQITL